MSDSLRPHVLYSPWNSPGQNTGVGPNTSWEIDGETVSDFILWAPKSLQMVTAAMKLKDAYSLEGKL